MTAEPIALLYLLGKAALCGMVGFIIVRRRPDIAWLPFALPPALFLLVQLAAFVVGERLATCDSPDCGPLMFVALVIVSGVFAASGFVGAVVGVLLARRRSA